MEVQEKIETKSAKIWFDNEGILHLKIKEGAEIDLQEIKECFKVYEKLGCKENKVLQIMEGGSFFTFDKDSQKYAAQYGKHFFIASALIHDSLAIRFLFNFFNNFFKHPVPFKMFSTKGEALQWLRTFKRE